MKYIVEGQLPKNNHLNNSNRYEFLKIAKIIRIDPIAMECDIKFLDMPGEWPKLSLSMPGWGPSSFMGLMPEIGSLVAVDFRQKGVSAEPVIVGYMPNMVRSAIQGDVITPVASNTDDVRARLRQIEPGNILLASSDATDVVIDEGFKVYTGLLSEFEIDDKDAFIKMTSTNNDVFTNAGIIRNGIIYRNDLLSSDSFADEFEKVIFKQRDGSDTYPVNTSDRTFNTPYGEMALGTNATEAFTEYRVELRETSDGIITKDSPYENDGLDGLTGKLPIVSLVMGTTVGNDSVSKEGKKLYGKVLVPKIFKNSSDAKGSFYEVPINNILEGKTVAGAYQLKIPNTSYAHTIDKQGHVFLNIPKSSNSETTLGSGRSAEINTEGSIKLAAGKNEEKGVSIDLTTDGSITGTLGGDTLGYSLNLSLNKGMKLSISAEAESALALEESINGGVLTQINGSRNTVINGDDIYNVSGNIEFRGLGKFVNNMIGDQSNNVAGDLSTMSTGGSSENIGLGKNLTVVAPDETGFAYNELFIAGNKNSTLTLGNNSKTLVAGNDIETITVGNKSVNVGTGNYLVNIGTGNLVVTTAVGNITLTASAGAISMTSSTSVNITAPTVNVIGGITNLGTNPVKGEVVVGGPLSLARDYLTGLPYIGSPTVRAGIT